MRRELQSSAQATRGQGSGVCNPRYGFSATVTFNTTTSHSREEDKAQSSLGAQKDGADRERQVREQTVLMKIVSLYYFIRFWYNLEVTDDYQM